MRASEDSLAFFFSEGSTNSEQQRTTPVTSSVLRRAAISTAPMGTKSAPVQRFARKSSSRPSSREAPELDMMRTSSMPQRQSRPPRTSSRGPLEMDMCKSSSLPRHARLVSPRSRDPSPRSASKKPIERIRSNRSSDVRADKSKSPDASQDSESGLNVSQLPSEDPLPPLVRLPSAIKAIQTELTVLQREFAEDACRVDLVDYDIFNWEVAVIGPERSPYQNGIFRFFLNFPPDYPEKLPRIRCATPVFHCNIDQSGNVCLGPFGKDGLSLQALAPRSENMEVAQSTFQIKLRITIISARGLRNADNLGLSDPFSTCHIPGKSWTTFQTAVIDNDLNPVWNEEHVITDYVPGDPLEFNVLDEDAGPGLDSRGDLLGRATLASTSFYPGGFDGDVNLSEAGKGHRATLRVRVSVLMPRQQHARTTAIDIVEGLLSLLTLPVLESPLVPSVAHLFKTDRRKHDRLAREWTLRHAL